MEIEVAQPNGIFLNAKLKEVSNKGISVIYNNDWATPELAAFDRCRVFLDKRSSSISLSNRLEVGSIVEVFIKQLDSEVHGWQKAKIREIKGKFVIVDCIDGPPNKGIVSLNFCRHVGQTTSVDFDQYKTFKISVPPELWNYFEDPNACNQLTETIKDIDVKYVKSDDGEKDIVISSFCQHAIRSAEILADAFMSNARHKKMLLEQLENNTVSSSMANGKFVEIFNVPDELTGLAIGKKGVNIAHARQIPGIVEITVDKTREETAGVCLFKIIGDSAEAVEQARGMLEYVFMAISVPKALVGQVVGRMGRNMQDIVNLSGAVKVQIGCGDEELEKEADEVDFIFTGTRESFNFAKLLVELQVKHINEMDAIRANINAIKSQMPNRMPISFSATGRRAPYQPPQLKDNDSKSSSQASSCKDEQTD